MKYRLKPGRLLTISIAVAAAFASGPVHAERPIEFNRDVRPILSNTCFYCHGPDEKHREADLRLDSFEGATADRDGSAAVVPGKPDVSLLLERITAYDDSRMPPPDSGKPALTDDEVATLKRWIAGGAKYEGHWSFLPLRTASPPSVSDKAWPKNPIDNFVLAQLDERKIKPSPEADRATLIRRASLDLLGLLPTPEEVEQFVNDRNPAAHDALVDRLLASPHYGERWGRHWLDQARYADSNGYSVDSERTMWPYRDWVIQALNRDLPFDQFTIEQLAGDLLPHATKMQIAATAFHRNTLINQEGGTNREQFRVESAIDRVNTTGAVWLGLTVGCAQCHTHKFDPITHREYYELFAFFNSTADANDAGPTLQVAPGEMFGPTSEGEVDPAERSDRAAWESAELKRLESQPNDSAEPIDWKPANYVEFGTESNAGLKRLADNSLLSDKRGSFNDTYRVVAKTDLPRIAAVRLRVLTDETLPKSGPGTASNGNFILTDFRLRVGDQDVKLAWAFADHSQPKYPVIAAIDRGPKSGWAINVDPNTSVKMNANHEATFVLEKPLEITDQPLEIKLYHNENQGYLVGRFALDFAATTPPEAKQAAADLLAALRVPETKRRAEEVSRIEQAYSLTLSPKPAANPGEVSLMVMREVKTPRTSYILTRGDFTRPDTSAGELEPGVLHAVAPKLADSDTQPTRLDLARWLVSPENPLTPRVTVNRMWMRYFGRGLVETEEDFGAQGSYPSHPELLDWLAGEFIRRDWSMKAMHRLIVTSATYRQSSHARPDLTTIDPRNLLLARQERSRLDAEIVRDAALTASGLLDRTIGGPSVHPPQSAGVYAFTQNVKVWTADTGGNRYRRGLYTFFYRSAPYPLLTTFDAPNFQTVCTRRVRSNTPLQALTLANDEAFIEMAQGIASRLLREVPGDAAQQRDARINRLFELCVSRQPNEQERRVAQAFYDQCVGDFAQNGSVGEALLSAELKREADKPATASLVSLARLMLNTDNFITRE